MKSEPRMMPHEAEMIGKSCRAAEDGNLLVGSFGAELAGESYPFSKAMCAIVFERFSDEELGHKFAAWMGKREAL